MKNTRSIIEKIVNKISEALVQWQNRRLLAQINRVYENDSEPEEKRLLEAHRKSFRKLIEDEW